MERAWIIISGLCLIAAAAFLWRANLDAAFVAATLGVVAWFLSLRHRLRKTITDAQDAENDGSEEQD
jgi:hypothetical protein